MNAHTDSASRSARSIALKATRYWQRSGKRLGNGAKGRGPPYGTRKSWVSCELLCTYSRRGYRKGGTRISNQVHDRTTGLSIRNTPTTITSDILFLINMISPEDLDQRDRV